MFRFMTTGESHGKCLTAVIDGIPAGLAIDADRINAELANRQQGYGRGGRMLIEKDKVEIVSGVRFGYTLGSPITMIIHNKDWTNWEERMSAYPPAKGQAVTAPRPGHADLAGILKYQREDIRDILERASARETAARVAVGAVARQVLELCGIKIASHVINIGGARIDNKTADYEYIVKNKVNSELGCIDPETEKKMKEVILAAKEKGDTVGGVFEVIAVNVIPGLGSHVHWDRRLDMQLAGAIMSIPAIKGVEFGAGFEYAELPGSKAHDEIFYNKDKGYYRKSNQAGGIEGGISNGEPIIVRAVMKPIPTLMSPLASVDIKTQSTVYASTERSDVCAVPAAAVVGEAMAAIALVSAVLEKFGGDHVEDVKAALAHYRQRIFR